MQKDTLQLQNFFVAKFPFLGEVFIYRTPFLSGHICVYSKSN